LKDTAIRWLDEIQPEENNITNGFEQLGLQTKSAFDSQAFIQLKTQYCDEKKCLSCAIGHHFIKTIEPQSLQPMELH
jgi:hypothetical protein